MEDTAKYRIARLLFASSVRVEGAAGIAAQVQSSADLIWSMELRSLSHDQLEELGCTFRMSWSDKTDLLIGQALR